jgi:hypothetical protein
LTENIATPKEPRYMMMRATITGAESGVLPDLAS